MNFNYKPYRDVVASVGPVSIVMCLSDPFYNYKSGVFYNPTCCTDTSHAMLITGYGTDPVGGDYWLVKNSWGNLLTKLLWECNKNIFCIPGTSWGEKGFVRMARNRKNNCNIAYYAVVCFHKTVDLPTFYLILFNFSMLHNVKRFSLASTKCGHERYA